MTYSASEYTECSSAPCTLFEFAQGTSTYWRYSSISYEIVLSSRTWSPAAIVPDKFSYTNDIPKDLISLEFPRDHVFAQQFTYGVPDKQVSLAVYRGHVDDDEIRAIWKGRVVAANVVGNVVALKCESIFSQLRRPGLRGVMMRTCRYQLFKAGCNLSPTAFRQTTGVSAINGLVLTATGAAFLEDLTGGTLIAADGSEHTIVVHNGQYLTLLHRSRYLEAALAAVYPSLLDVDLYRGCDGSFQTCCDVFSNAGNFGGFPGIPSKDPTKFPVT
jgi:hypothetical protein